MRCIALLLAGVLMSMPCWPADEQNLNEIETALIDEQKAWALASESSTGLTDYFSGERARLTSEREGLQQEKASLATEKAQSQQERDALAALRRQLQSDRLQISEDSTRLDEREKRIERGENLLRWVPAAALVVFSAGFLTAVALR